MRTIAEDAETVVLVHGLWMHGIVFLPQRRLLRRHGFTVRWFSYPSVRRSLRQNARALARFISATNRTTVHLVGHSLGGLVVLSMLAQYPDSRVRRAVLMGSPAAGCHCASVLAGTPGLSAIVGRSIKDWLALPPPELPASVEIGVLAGTRSLGLGRIIPGLPRPNDGVVCVEETRLPGMKDFITLPVSHSEMLVSRACADQVAAFLRTGSFSRA